MKKNKRYKVGFNRGFTVAEMLVVFVIFVSLSGIILFRFPTYITQVTLDTLSQEIALAIREAQVYSLSGSFLDVETIPPPGYGVYFQDGASSFILFADDDGSNRYESSQDRVVQTFNFQDGFIIESLVVYTGGSGSSPVGDEVHVAFARPNPDANIHDETSVSSYEQAEIIIQGLRENTQSSINVFMNGQITNQ